MDYVAIDRAITQLVRHYVKRLQPKQSQQPTSQPLAKLSRFDHMSSSRKQCRAVRMKLQGVLVGKKGLRRFLRRLDRTSQITKTSQRVPDLDGDGKVERLQQYRMKPSRKMPKLPSQHLCGHSQWDTIAMQYQPFLYVFHLSKGEKAVVQSTMFLLTGKKR